VSINRHNYEEFFLLYVDNELQQAERAEVEDFVKQNPDLVSELEMLKQATLQQEHFSFDHKELLYKKEDGISLANYEEYFVLSVDDELTSKEADEVEKFVLKHPQLQNEFTLLKQTRLEPEVVEFTGKEVLYKTEKERRLIPIMWMRVSVAAAVIGLVAFTWIFSHQSGTTYKQGTETASANQATKSTENKISGTTVTPQPADSLEVKTGEKEEAELAKGAVRDVQQAKTITSTKNNEVAAATVKKSGGVKEISNTANTLALAAGQQPKEIFEVESGTKPGATTDVRTITDNPRASFAAQKNQTEETHFANAVYREVDTNEEENTVLIGGAQINKNKLKGLFKKAAQLLGKKSSDNEEEKTLQIAGFEFKSK
jgi:hypothetical protein